MPQPTTQQPWSERLYSRLDQKNRVGDLFGTPAAIKGYYEGSGMGGDGRGLGYGGAVYVQEGGGVSVARDNEDAAYQRGRKIRLKKVG